MASERMIYTTNMHPFRTEKDVQQQIRLNYWPLFHNTKLAKILLLSREMTRCEYQPLCMDKDVSVPQLCSNGIAPVTAHSSASMWHRGVRP